MDVEAVTKKVYEALGSSFESMSLKTRGGDHILVEWSENDPGDRGTRYYEAEIRVVGVCDMTAEVMAQAEDDRLYENDQAVGAYEMYGPDRPTWREMFPNE